MDLRALRDLPNQLGFKFTGVYRDGTHRDCVVTHDSLGRHTVDDWSLLTGWLTNKHTAFAVK